MANVLWIVAGLAVPSICAASDMGRSIGQACAAGVNHATDRPAFCSIPAVPTDVRSAAAFKSAVVETRLVGRKLVRDNDSGAFSLPAGGADAFSNSAQAIAAPPVAPPVSDTEAFAKEARREVTPPARARRSSPLNNKQP